MLRSRIALIAFMLLTLLLVYGSLLAGPVDRAGGAQPFAPAVTPTLDQINYLPLVARNYREPRPWPDTTQGIHVFNDQLSEGLGNALLNFAATRYAGTQKMTRAEADRLRAFNSDFLILHYRLGHGLGYRQTSTGCVPDGAWLQIIDGTWVQEWPGDTVVQEDWFYHQPVTSTQRVLNCVWGWHLMELNDPDYRAYWHAAVLNQVFANDNDGVFLDSLSVPNYLGSGDFNPNLPEVNPAFESAWSARIADWLTWLQSQSLGQYPLVVNVGSWVTSRDATDYSAADGLMIEGFAIQDDVDPYDLADWQLQMNRILGAVDAGQIIILQAYANQAQERMFTLGSYLLVKGNRTFLNIELVGSANPEWWPEYDIAIGAPTQSAGTDIDNLYDAVNQVYRRNFDNGFVLVNPADSGAPVFIDLGGTYYRAVTSGGGLVPVNGVPGGTVTYQPVTSVNLPPYSAAVLFDEQP